MERSRGGGGAEGRPSGAPFGAREYVEFHNPTAAVRIASLRFDLRGLPPDARTTLRFTPYKTQRPAGEAMTGIARSVTLTGARPSEGRRGVGETVSDVRRAWQPPPRRRRALWAALRRFFGRLCRCLPEYRQKPAYRLPKFEPIVHEVAPASEVVVHDVVLAPFERVGALLELEGDSLAHGERVFHVQQIVDGQVAGGSMYIIGVDDEEKPEPQVADVHRLDQTVIDPTTLQELEEEARKWRYVPPWIKEAMDERELEVGMSVDPKRDGPIEDDDNDNRQPSY